MIVGMKKFLLIGTQDDVDEFFARAQHEGFLEFISIHGKKTVELPATIHQLVSALKIIRKLPVLPPYTKGGDLEYAKKIAQRILILKGDIEKLAEEKRLLNAEIARVQPFGDFSMDDIHYIERESGKKIQFFCRKTSKRDEGNIPEDMIYVGTDYDLDYFIAINPAPVFYTGMIEMRIDRSVGELRDHLAMIQETFEKAEDELKQYAGHIRFLHEALIEELNAFHLEKAKKEISHPIEDAVFAIEAWVPKNKVNDLYNLIAPLKIHAEEVAIDPDDRVPTCMQNKGMIEVGEDLVKIYDIPATTDRDPSAWVLWAFALFFAMIVNDGGYGLVYLALAGLLFWKFPEGVRRNIRSYKLFVLLGASCFVWGIMTSSYFGIKLSPENPLARASITQHLVDKKLDYHLHAHDDVYEEWSLKIPEIKQVSTAEQLYKVVPPKENKELHELLDEFNDNILLEFSLLIGVIHISLSLLRYCLRNIANIGWVAFLVGGYLFFPSMLHATSLVHFLGWVDKQTATEVGIQMLYGGIAFALVAALIQKRLKGAGEVMQSVQVFADVLSYLRLYALGLAGSIMASTFNDMGAGVGFAVGTVIALLGHSVNILLASMGGAIHGLRLNFLEWYHYSFDGGGRLFNPLRKLKAK